MERIAIKTLLEKENKKNYLNFSTMIDAYTEINTNVFLLKKSKVGSQKFQPALIDENKRIYFTLKKGRLLEKFW